MQDLTMPNTIFETDRLYVRRFTESDEENFYLLNSDQEVMQYIRRLKNREESRHFLLSNIDAYAKNPMTGRWAVHEKKGDQFVGMFAIIPLENTNYWQVGYALLKDYWGKGYATELTLTGIQYAFRKMMVSKLTAVTEVSNENSRHVLLKAGFKQTKNIIEDDKELYLFEIYNNAVVETKRLLIAALDNFQLNLYIGANNRLENELGLKSGDRVVSKDLQQMSDQVTIPAMRNANEGNYYFYTIWIVIDKAQNSLVAELGFKGTPNTRGEIEIGYGTLPLFQGKGYMTEAVDGMLGWAKNFPGVRSVVAETENTNSSSIRVLEKNGFQLVSKRGEMLIWTCRLDILIRQ
ncbi:MAG TPA: GNAT family N-acetyltransferase [Flavitalea sp.]|nr:GNAT family N-acetyltransferase [Flavitalea sp.]